MSAPVYVGIDVAKVSFEVAIKAQFDHGSRTERSENGPRSRL